MTTDMPFTTKNLRRFNQDTRKAETTTSKAITASKILKPATRQQLATILQDADNLGDLFTTPSKVKEILDLFIRDGVILPNELAQYIRENGSLTGAGRDLVEQAMFGAAFDEAEIKQIASFTTTQRNTLLKAAGHIIENRTFGEYSLE